MLIVRTTEGNTPVSLTQPKRVWSIPEIYSILHVSACDYELRYIKERLGVPVPHPLPDTVTWFGDTARFIVANL